MRENGIRGVGDDSTEAEQGRHGKQSNHETVDEPVWSFRGYELKAGDFTTAMVHLFRAEIGRANVWRQRLDTTTNWAVVTTAATTSVAFSTSGGHHGVIILTTLLISIFLYIEARRYRYYELWSSRVRLMETDFFAAMLVPPFQPSPDWAESLAENLLQPHFPITMWEAFGRRFRRNYLWIYVVLWLTWGLKVWIHPAPTSSLAELLDRASLGSVPGWVVIIFGLVFLIVMTLVGLLTVTLQEASGEVLPRFGSLTAPVLTRGESKGAQGGARRAWYRPHGRRQQLLTLIVTDREKQVAESILANMHRGVTSLAAVGMYTGASHAVLLCALTVTEVARLESLVQVEDPKAFVVVLPAQEILGRGFEVMAPTE